MKQKLNTETQAIPENGKKVEVTVARILAMIMIILCHLCSWLGQNALAMFFNVGVYVFLFISGMLYSQKSIDRAGKFLLKRWIKLCTPLYWLALPLLVVGVINSGRNQLISLPVYLLNLQGMNFILPQLRIPQINGLEQTWFLTVIMICYIILVPVKYFIKDSIWKNKVYVRLGALVFILIDVLAVYIFRARLNYFLMFFVGYGIGKMGKRMSIQSYLLAWICMMIAMAGRLLGRKFLDGTVLYGDIIIPFTHMILAVWIFATIQLIAMYAPGMMRRVVDSRIMCNLEKLSMYLYLTHCMFLTGPFFVDRLPVLQLVQIVIFLGMTLLSAVFLKAISEKTISEFYNIR